MIEKPRYGDPCNGCGMCCEEVLCPLGKLLFDRSYGTCPALEREGEKRVCGLVKTPVAYNLRGVLEHGEKTVSDAAGLLVGASRGCDTQAFGEIVNPTAVERLRSAAFAIPPKILRKAKAIWRVK